MKEIDLIKNLKSLKGIEPGEDFVNRSKTVLLSYPKRMPMGLEVVGHGVIAQSFNLGLSMILTAAALILVLGGAASALRAALLNNLPGVNTAALLSEAEAVNKDIDIELEEAEYYAVAAKSTSLALKEASLNGPAHTNPLLIKNEANRLEFQDPTNNDIDKLLNAASQ